MTTFLNFFHIVTISGVLFNTEKISTDPATVVNTLQLKNINVKLNIDICPIHKNHLNATNISSYTNYFIQYRKNKIFSSINYDNMSYKLMEQNYKVMLDFVYNVIDDETCKTFIKELANVEFDVLSNHKELGRVVFNGLTTDKSRAKMFHFEFDFTKMLVRYVTYEGIINLSKL